MNATPTSAERKIIVVEHGLPKELRGTPHYTALTMLLSLWLQGLDEHHPALGGSTAVGLNDIASASTPHGRFVRDVYPATITTRMDIKGSETRAGCCFVTISFSQRDRHLGFIMFTYDSKDGSVSDITFKNATQ